MTQTAQKDDSVYNKISNYTIKLIMNHVITGENLLCGLSFV